MPMKPAKGQLKKHSDGTDKSPFIKGKHKTTKKLNPQTGGDRGEKKSPRIKGQK